MTRDSKAEANETKRKYLKKNPPNSNVIHFEQCRLLPGQVFQLQDPIEMHVANGTVHTWLGQGFLVVGLNLDYKNLAKIIKQKSFYIDK